MEIEETYSNDGIECPHCGYLETEGEVIYNQEIEDYECGSCGKKIDVSIYVSWSWTCNARTKEVIEKDIECEESNKNRNILTKKFDHMTEEEFERANINIAERYDYKIGKLKKELEELNND